MLFAWSLSNTPSATAVESFNARSETALSFPKSLMFCWKSCFSFLPGSEPKKPFPKVSSISTESVYFVYWLFDLRLSINSDEPTLPVISPIAFRPLLVAERSFANCAALPAIALRCLLNKYAPAATAANATTIPCGPVRPAIIGANWATVAAPPSAAVTCGGAPAIPATIAAVPSPPDNFPETFPTFSLRMPRFF